MSRSPEITPESVQSALEPLSRVSATYAKFRRAREAEESSLTRDNRFKLIDFGDVYTGQDRISQDKAYAFTTRTLRGLSERLGAGTIAQYGLMSLPKDTSPSGIEDYLYGAEPEVDIFAHLYLNERTWLGGATKREFTGYFEAENEGIGIGVEGLVRFLNVGQSGFLDLSETQERIDEAQRKIDEADNDRFEAFEKAVSESFGD